MSPSASKELYKIGKYNFMGSVFLLSPVFVLWEKIIDFYEKTFLPTQCFTFILVFLLILII